MSQRYKYVGPNGFKCSPAAPAYRIDDFIGFSYMFACMYDNVQVLHLQISDHSIDIINLNTLIFPIAARAFNFSAIQEMQPYQFVGMYIRSFPLIQIYEILRSSRRLSNLVT